MTLLKLHPTILFFGIAKAFDISIHSLATVGVSSTLTWTRAIDDPQDIQLVLLDQIRAVRKTLIPKVPLTEEGNVAVVFEYPSDFLIQGVSGGNESSILASRHIKAELSPAGTRSPAIAESALVFETAFPSIQRSSYVPEIGSIVIDSTSTETSSLETGSMSTLTSSSLSFQAVPTLPLPAAASTTSRLITSTILSASHQSTTTNPFPNGTATSGISSTSSQSQNSHQATVNIHTVIIIGVVSGTLFFVILFLVAISILCRRRRHRRRDSGRTRIRRSRPETSSAGPPVMYQALVHPEPGDLAAESSRPRNLDHMYQNGDYSGTASHLRSNSLEDGSEPSYLDLSASAAALGSDPGNDSRRMNRRKREGVIDFRDMWNGSDSAQGARLLSETPLSTTGMNGVETSHSASMARSRSDAQPRMDVMQQGLSSRYSQVHSVSNSNPESGRPIPESESWVSIEHTSISPSIPSVPYKHPPVHKAKSSASANSPPKPLYIDSPSPNMGLSQFLPLPEYQQYTNTQRLTTTSSSMTSCWVESEESESNPDKELQRLIDEREAGWAMEGFLEPLPLDSSPPSYGV